MTPSGQATNGLTGPSRDHTLGLSSGKYLLAEADGHALGDQAVFETPVLFLENENDFCRISLYLHMWGDEMNTFKMFLVEYGQEPKEVNKLKWISKVS